jgi:hypothetical protein
MPAIRWVKNENVSDSRIQTPQFRQEYAPPWQVATPRIAAPSPGAASAALTQNSSAVHASPAFGAAVPTCTCSRSAKCNSKTMLSQTAPGHGILCYFHRAGTSRTLLVRSMHALVVFDSLKQFWRSYRRGAPQCAPTITDNSPERRSKCATAKCYPSGAKHEGRPQTQSSCIRLKQPDLLRLDWG